MKLAGYAGSLSAPLGGRITDRLRVPQMFAWLNQSRRLRVQDDKRA
jgi:hypothetical protein